MIETDFLNKFPEFLTVEHLIEIFGVSKNTVYSWCNHGGLPSFKIGNTRRIRKSTLMQWISENEGPGGQEGGTTHVEQTSY